MIGNMFNCKHHRPHTEALSPPAEWSTKSTPHMYLAVAFKDLMQPFMSSVVSFFINAQAQGLKE